MKTICVAVALMDCSSATLWKHKSLLAICVMQRILQWKTRLQSPLKYMRKCLQMLNERWN